MSAPEQPSAPVRMIRERLAEELNITAANIGRYLSKPGCPQPDENRTYDVQAISDFISGLGLQAHSNAKVAKGLTGWKEKVAAETWRTLRNKNLVLEKKVVKTSVLETEMARHGASAKEKLYMKLCQEAPPRLHLCKSVEEVRVMCREIADEVSAAMSGLFDQWKQPEVKP